MMNKWDGYTMLGYSEAVDMFGKDKVKLYSDGCVYLDNGDGHVEHIGFDFDCERGYWEHEEYIPYDVFPFDNEVCKVVEHEQE